MRGLSFFCLSTAILYALAAMALGIFMAISQDHTLSPAHAHLNLVGWVTVALYGFYYNAVPASATTTLAKAQVGAATLGVILLSPGIALAVLGKTEALAAIGSIITLLGMLLFAVVIVRSRQVIA